jgi:hypothetical protein
MPRENATKKLGFERDGGEYDRLLDITTHPRIWGRLSPDFTISFNHIRSHSE